ncbi:DUF2835 domain-containing protein [Salinimonas marina]|uniref:DUF2835 domain-containing protein n=1 Tax=Salinimonas marina TaxID=2785918 RepID=A0A7S9E005_9ALTE|nr:DUF2835 family protein [Salinimonas marina]QPG07063.1 DUF2835 domain-containing protein [Salinimonas marina]
MNNNKYFHFSLGLTYTECERLYQAGYQHVVVMAESGHRVQLPIERLRAFVTPSGLQGRFRLTTTAAHKILTFERLS